MTLKLIGIVVAIVVGLLYFFRNGLSISSFGGYSVSSSGDTICVSGKVLSLTKNGICVMGDSSLPSNNTNSISQSNQNGSLEIKGGHVVFTGKSKIKINGKEF